MQPRASPDNHTENPAPGRWHAANLLVHPGIIISAIVGAIAIVGAFEAIGSDRQAPPKHRFGSCNPLSGICAAIARDNSGLRETRVYLANAATIDDAGRSSYEPATADLGDAGRFNPAEQNRPGAIRAELGPTEDLTLEPSEESRPSKKLEGEQGDRTTVLQRDLVIDRDLRRTLAAAGISSAVTRELLKAVSFDPDFPRHPPSGSRLTLGYESSSSDGSLKRASHLLYAIVDDGRKTHEIFRYSLSSTMIAFLSRNGVGGAIVSLQDPIPGASITSGYGWRVHPILEVWKFHNGVDYAAPLGTPVRAAGDGIIEEVGWHGQNGKYIRIRHGAHLVTTYSHLNGFAASAKEGRRVHRGQVIAFVGQTGLATGPHLYYEVVVDSRPVRPVGTPIVVPVRLAESELAGFRHYLDVNADFH